MADELHVRQLLHHLALGGLENQVLRTIRATEDPAVTFAVGYFGTDESRLDAFADAGVDVVRLGRGSGAPARQFSPRTLRRTTEFLADGDVGHCHGSLYLHVLGRLCGRAAGVPMVGTFHNTSENFHPTMRAAERHTRSLAETSVAVSLGVERTYAGDAARYDPGQPLERDTYTIYNGIDVEAFRASVDAADAAATRSDLGVADDELLALTVGRYAPEKNQQGVIEALAAAGDDLSSVHAVLVGWGDREDALRRSARELGVADRVTVTGRVPSVEAYYAAADAFVLPSTTEGLSVTLLEAMAADLPVVATDVAGTAEAVVDGETGYVVAPDSPSALAAALGRLTDPQRRRVLGQCGLERVRETFDVRETAAAYETLYRTVAGR